MISDTQLPLSSGVFEHKLCCYVSDFIYDHFLCKALAGRPEPFCLLEVCYVFVQKEKLQRASQRLVFCGGKIHFERYMPLIMPSTYQLESPVFRLLWWVSLGIET